MYALLSVSATRHYLQEVNQSFNRDLARTLVADRKLVQEGRINQAALKETFDYYMAINPSIEIYLLDLNGTILSYSAEPGKVKRNSVSLEPIEAFLENSAVYPLLGDDPRSHERHKAFSVTPVPTEESPQGYLYVILRGEQFDSVDQAIQESYFLRLSGWAVVGSLVFGLLMGLVLFHVLTRRLRHLTQAMNHFQKSDFSTEVSFFNNPNTKPSDEIDRLEGTFGRMARRIITQLQELNKKDALRRELVAQVSHDIRTPLASLHGFLETLQVKEQTLSASKRAEYVAIALHHSKRLKRLVEELFELAKLDANEIRPHAEPFSVAELVQDVVLEFQLKAQHKGIDLTMKAPDALPFVTAEIGLIERVLVNLLENALDHTPKGEQISVTVQLQEPVVIISVADTGCGIASSDLPQIFDPFYQAGNPHRGDHHAGLGLAIAKRIVELHGSDIKVSTEINKGTTFSFELPLWTP
jgi:signal transduction histidine kinase